MAYIDPGTGSMLFTVLVSVLGAGAYSLRMFSIKMHAKLSGGKVEVDKEKLPLVIFSDNKRYWPIFAPVCKKLSEKELDVLYLTASPDDKGLSCDLPHFKAECIENQNKLFTRLNFLNATILLSTTPGLDVYQWKRSKNVDYYVHILHAASEVVLYRMFGIDYYDAVLLSGDYQEKDIRALEELRSLPAKELYKIGIPYMDEMAKRLKNCTTPVPPAKEGKTVLLAPSWGKSAILSVYGGKIIDVLLQTGYHVIVRPHPQSFISETEMMEHLMKQYPASDRLEWNRDTDNFDVLRRADILVSDFSGVVFDFTLVYNKPVIYTDPDFDLSPYDAWWMKTPLWTVSALPRLGQRLTEENMGDLKNVIDTCLEDPRYAEGRQQVREETWAYFGEGASRCADYLERKYHSLKNQSGKERS